MQLALVQGRATSTVKHRSLAGAKLLICSLLDSQGKPAGDPVLVIDQLGAGHGDTVLLTSDGQGLRQLMNNINCPARWWTLGIMDE